MELLLRCEAYLNMCSDVTCSSRDGVHATGRDGQLSLAESRLMPSEEDVVQSAEIGTDALSRAEEEQNLAERPEDELEAMQVRLQDPDIAIRLCRSVCYPVTA